MEKVLIVVKLLRDPAAEHDVIRREHILHIVEVLVQPLRPIPPSQSAVFDQSRRGIVLRVLPLELQVTQLRVGDQDTMAEQSTSDSGTEREEQDRPGQLLGRPERLLSDPGCVGVVQHGHRRPVTGGQLRRHRSTDPAVIDVGGGIYHTVFDH